MKPRKGKLKPRHPDRLVGYRTFGHAHKIVAIYFYFGFGVAAICRITGFKEHMVRKCSHARETFAFMSEITNHIEGSMRDSDLIGLLKKNCLDSIRVLGEIVNDPKADAKDRMAASKENFKNFRDLTALQEQTGLPAGTSQVTESLTRVRTVLHNTEQKELPACDSPEITVEQSEPEEDVL